MNEPEASKWTYRCPECGSSRVQGTAWIELNTNEVLESDSPVDYYWCAACDEAGNDGTIYTMCSVNQETCESHGTQRGDHDLDGCALRFAPFKGVV